MQFPNAAWPFSRDRDLGKGGSGRSKSTSFPEDVAFSLV